MKQLKYVTKQKKVLFSNIPVGSWFYDVYNCNYWIKRSTRTAELIQNHRVFYFSQNEIYTISYKEIINY